MLNALQGTTVYCSWKMEGAWLVNAWVFLNKYGFHAVLRLSWIIKIIELCLHLILRLHFVVQHDFKHLNAEHTNLRSKIRSQNLSTILLLITSKNIFDDGLK